MTDLTALKQASILVTGATGFIGPHLVRRLLAAGAQVTCLILSEAEQGELPARVTCHVADLRDAGAVRAVVQAVRPAIVLHLAAVGVTEFGIDPIAAVQVNVEGTLNLLTGLKGSGYRRFVFAGTSHEYGANPSPFREDQPPAPTNVYAASKSAAWLFCQMYHRAQNWPVVCVRPFGAYGPGQRPPAFLPTLIQSALHGQAFPMTGGEQVRDLIYVQDVVEGMIRAATVPGIEGQIFNLCSGKGVSLAELARRVLALMDDPGHLELGALPYRPGVMWRMVGDNSQAGQALDWRPVTSLDEGLRRTIAWCTTHLSHDGPRSGSH
jgi:nucleoside-diphosphate-sugar epimerase